MLKVAITGGIACGKSLAGRYVAAMGFAVLDADDVARDVLAKGDPVRGQVEEAFGPGILSPDGEVDRAALAREVFQDDGKRQRLNALTHPEIMRRIRCWVGDQPASARCVVVIIPLLYEVGDESNWDAVICVTAPEREQMARLEGRGMAAGEAEARIRSQWRQEVKMERADYVIFNGGSEALLREQVEKVMRSILGG